MLPWLLAYIPLSSSSFLGWILLLFLMFLCPPLHLRRKTHHNLRKHRRIMTVANLLGLMPPQVTPARITLLLKSSSTVMTTTLTRSLTLMSRFFGTMTLRLDRIGLLCLRITAC
uniref:Uncharacterized protein n=1 Tax=Calypogeia fissa associated deltaflexivirus TaxID=2933106 RepID=A0A9C7GWK4_9VIRU|nr:hypothetical protein 3 [Calypogeia fissa associated deltaflexivirus]CAI5383918.1 hypothetical protein 3 [Calypogeia fissa associated deltaflexivirus]